MSVQVDMFQAATDYDTPDPLAVSLGMGVDSFGVDRGIALDSTSGESGLVVKPGDFIKEARAVRR